MERRRRIGHSTVLVRCRDELKVEAEALLDQLVVLNERQPLAHGTTIQLGWAFVTLRGDDDQLLVCQPAFGTRDLEGAFLPRADDVLTVARDQRGVLSRLGIEGVTVRYDDTVTFWRGALDQPQIYLERLATEVPRSSGWHLDGSRMRMERKASDETETIASHHLLSFQPGVLGVLPLPPGYTVLVEGQQIQAVFAPDNKNVWALPDSRVPR